MSAAVQRTLSSYYNAINAGRYDVELQQFTAAFAAKFDPDQLASDLATSFDFGVVIHEVTDTSGGAQAWVTFVSVQDPAYGYEAQSCSKWSLDYTFVDSADQLLIDDVGFHGGAEEPDAC